MRILFVTNGLGLGNSTRCHAIIQRLHDRGARVEMVTSGNGLWYFSDKPEISTIHEIEPLTYGEKDGKINITRTFASFAHMIDIFRQNTRKIGSVLDQIEPDVVVTDSDYNFIPIKRRDIPIAALNNADVVWHSYFQFGDRPRSIRAQFYGVEMLDRYFHRMVPDLVLSPCLDPTVRQDGGKILRIGPVVRAGYDAAVRTEPPRRAVVMLSGSVFGTPVNFNKRSYPIRVDVIGREQPDEWVGAEDVTFYGKIKITFSLLEHADVAVVNGGFSAVSEMFWMKKPLVVVPVQNHAEQWINARTISHLGLGLIATQTDYEDKMLEVVKRVDEFRAAYERLGGMEDGASQAADAILNLASSKIS